MMRHMAHKSHHKINHYTRIVDINRNKQEEFIEYPIRSLVIETKKTKNLYYLNHLVVD